MNQTMNESKIKVETQIKNAMFINLNVRGTKLKNRKNRN